MLTARTFLVRGLLAGLDRRHRHLRGGLRRRRTVGGNAAIAIEEAAARRRGRTTTTNACRPRPAEPTSTRTATRHAMVSRQNQATWGLATATVALRRRPRRHRRAGRGVRLRSARPAQPAGEHRAGRRARLRRGLPGAVPEVPAEPAGGRQPGHHRAAHRLVLLHAGRLGGRRGHRGRSSARRLAAPDRRLERRAGRRRPATSSSCWSTAWLLPTVDEVPDDFPADLLWRFRTASLTVQSTLWAVIGARPGHHDRLGGRANVGRLRTGRAAGRHRGVTAGRPPPSVADP